MRPELLKLLQCPLCSAKLELTPYASDDREVRRGVLTCAGLKPHTFEIEDGIIRFQSGFDHEAVKKELEYENSTYKGSDRLTDANLIAQFPETLKELWPHTCHFGPDFRALIDRINLPRGAWVLDIGTGPCWSTRLLAQRGYNTIALDVNEANYYGLRTSDILFKAHDVYFERILESMTHMPFKDGTFDAVTFNASFHHTPDMERTLEECARVLKPGGVAAMVNEEFASVRQRFQAGQVTDGGSHHTIYYAEFAEAARNLHFDVDYYVADHVAVSLRRKLGNGLGNIAVNVLETFPFLLKQLNSALIVLKKPGVAGSRGPTAQVDSRPEFAATVPGNELSAVADRK